MVAALNLQIQRIQVGRAQVATPGVRGACCQLEVARGRRIVPGMEQFDHPECEGASHQWPGRSCAVVPLGENTVGIGEIHAVASDHRGADRLAGRDRRNEVAVRHEGTQQARRHPGRQRGTGRSFRAAGGAVPIEIRRRDREPRLDADARAPAHCGHRVQGDPRTCDRDPAESCTLEKFGEGAL